VPCKHSCLVTIKIPCSHKRFKKKFEDTCTIGIIRSRKWKYRKYNGQKDKQLSTNGSTENTMAKRTNNHLQSISEKTKDRAT